MMNTGWPSNVSKDNQSSFLCLEISVEVKTKWYTVHEYS